MLYLYLVCACRLYQSMHPNIIVEHKSSYSTS